MCHSILICDENEGGGRGVFKKIRRFLKNVFVSMEEKTRDNSCLLIYFT